MPAHYDRTSRLPLSLSADPPTRSGRVTSRPSAAIRRAVLACVLATGLLAGGASVQAQTPAAPAAPAPSPPPADDKSSLGSLWSSPAWNAPEPWRTDKWYVQFAYYTLHFNPDPDHQQSYLVDLSYNLDEEWLEGKWMVGLALFQNSFGQFSQYLYGGLKWRPWKEQPPFYVKLSAGLLHGYKGEYRDKIPFNGSGIAPAIIPSVGYCWVRYCGEFVLLGGNAALFTVGMTIP